MEALDNDLLANIGLALGTNAQCPVRVSWEQSLSLYTHENRIWWETISNFTYVFFQLNNYRRQRLLSPQLILFFWSLHLPGTWPVLNTEFLPFTIQYIFILNVNCHACHVHPNYMSTICRTIRNLPAAPIQGATITNWASWRSNGIRQKVLKQQINIGDSMHSWLLNPGVAWRKAWLSTFAPRNRSSSCGSNTAGFE